jgi:exosortase D (VPLPA-CTERM-specific)
MSADRDIGTSLKSGFLIWAIVLTGAALLVVATWSSLGNMVQHWEGSEEYGYGFMIPFVAAFLIWQRKDRLSRLEFSGSWFGLAILLVGLLIVFAGQLGTLNSVTQYGFLISLVGGAWSLMGWRAFRVILTPLLLLFLMVPLPPFLYNNLSSQLQLISSQIGVAVIRLFGISVYLEGNVIDLGTYKLQVVEACSGLRYLFPLVSLSIIAAYFYRDAIWKRIVVVLSSIPITVFMNSFRIGVIAMLVEYGGLAQTEGFLHYFEGWAVFMGCVALLIVEMWVLSRLGSRRKPFSEVFSFEFPQSPREVQFLHRQLVVPAVAALLLIGAGTAASIAVSGRMERFPERLSFDGFPRKLGRWEGQPGQMESIYLDALKLDDYVISDYHDNAGKVINFYSAYYASQRSGASVHSPSSCIPGGGWVIKDRTVRAIDDVKFHGKPLEVNRLLITKGDSSELVYYWFQERGRDITNEYLVKWYLLWDAMTRNRTDGALVRLTAFVNPGEDLAAVDRRLVEFAREVNPYLSEYITD